MGLETIVSKASGGQEFAPLAALSSVAKNRVPDTTIPDTHKLRRVERDGALCDAQQAHLATKTPQDSYSPEIMPRNAAPVSSVEKAFTHGVEGSIVMIQMVSTSAARHE
ncbi:hypothetical protein NMY22_g15517 [Coprinellus aureogranulatus]|nr:hypothetical protein NMY22_g15517 [Coprinellus aureogranulatus]